MGDLYFGEKGNLVNGRGPHHPFSILVKLFGMHGSTNIHRPADEYACHVGASPATDTNPASSDPHAGDHLCLFSTSLYVSSVSIRCPLS